jgi:hypothetical protein
MLLYAAHAEDEVHVWEPWTGRGSRIPSMEDALGCAEVLVERGLCERGSGDAWVKAQPAGVQYVAQNLERYRRLYPYVQLAEAGQADEPD